MNTVSLHMYRRRIVHLALGVTVIFFLVFGLTVSKQVVYYADSSDLLLAGVYGGLAHPPGYPLYVSLLHVLVTAFPQVPPSLLGGWFAAFSMGAVMGLMLFLVVGLVERIFGTRLWLGSILLPLLLWAAIPLNWTLATIPEVMPLSLLLLLGLCISCLEPLRKITHNPRYALASGFWGILASLYHPLLIGAVLWIWFLWMMYWRCSWRTWFFAWFRGLWAGLLLTLLLYLVLAKGDSWYSWEVPSTLMGWWHFWSRQVYTESGSAIEMLSHDRQITKIIDGIYRWGKWWMSDQQSLLISFLALGGGISLVVKKKTRWLLFLVVLFIMYGVGLAAYLKHPESYPLAETAQWWGIALRERMFYVFPIVMVVFASMLMGALENLRGFLVPFFRVGICMGIVVCGYGIWLLFNLHISPENNAAQVFVGRILEGLPPYATLLVDDDDIFGLLYAQALLGIRQDVTTIPVGMVLMPRWWNVYQGQVARDGFSTNKHVFITDVVSTVLDSRKRVFLYGVDSSELEALGVEGNPFYARPWGYALEILAAPYGAIPSAEYGLSVQVAAIKTEKTNSWFKGFRTHLGTIHAQQAYFLARMGFEKEASWHTTVAGDLFYKEASKEVVQNIFIEGKRRFETYGSYLNYHE